MLRRRFGMALVLVALSCPTASAQVITVSAPSAGDLLASLGELLALVSPGDAGRPAREALERLRAPGALRGIDPARPIGAFLNLPDRPADPPTVVLFAPIDEAGPVAFLEALTGQGCAVSPRDDPGGFGHEIVAPGGGPRMFALFASGYAYMSSNPTGAKVLRDLKPADLRADLTDPGDLSASLGLDRLPAGLVDAFRAQFAQTVKKDEARRPDESDATYQGRLAGSRFAFEVLDGLARDGRKVTLDLDIQADRGTLDLALAIEARPDSEMAGVFRRLGMIREAAPGLDPSEALGLRFNLPMTDLVRGLIAQGFREAVRDAEASAKDPDEAGRVTRFFDAFRPTLDGDSIAMGLSILGPFPAEEQADDPEFVMVMATPVRDGGRIERAFRELALNPRLGVEVTLDSARSRDGKASIHQLHKPAPEGGVAGPSPFGAAVVQMAFRDDLMIASMGDQDHGLAALQAILDRPGPPAVAALPPVEFRFEVDKVAMLAESESDRQTIRAASDAAFRGEHADRRSVRMELRAKDDVLRLQLSADLPALRFLAAIGERKREAQAGKVP